MGAAFLWEKKKKQQKQQKTKKLFKIGNFFLI